MLTKDFSYDLPEDLIAQNPVNERGTGRMLVLEKELGITDALFQKLPEYLKSGDLIVLNDTSVIPARLYLEKDWGNSEEAVGKMYEWLDDLVLFTGYVPRLHLPVLYQNSSAFILPKLLISILC